MYRTESLGIFNIGGLLPYTVSMRLTPMRRAMSSPNRGYWSSMIATFCNSHSDWMGLWKRKE